MSEQRKQWLFVLAACVVVVLLWPVKVHGVWLVGFLWDFVAGVPNFLTILVVVGLVLYVLWSVLSYVWRSAARAARKP